MSASSVQTNSTDVESWVIVRTPRVPIDAVHMLEWKQFASDIIDLEQRRRGCRREILEAELANAAGHVGENAVKNMRAQTRPTNKKRFSRRTYARIFPVLLLWRERAIEGRGRERRQAIDDGDVASLLAKLRISD